MRHILATIALVGALSANTANAANDSGAACNSVFKMIDLNTKFITLALDDALQAPVKDRMRLYAAVNDHIRNTLAATQLLRVLTCLGR